MTNRKRRDNRRANKILTHNKNLARIKERVFKGGGLVKKKRKKEKKKKDIICFSSLPKPSLPLFSPLQFALHIFQAVSSSFKPFRSFPLRRRNSLVFLYSAVEAGASKSPEFPRISSLPFSIFTQLNSRFPPARSSRCSGLPDSTGAPRSPPPCRTARTPEDDADGAHLKSLEDEPLLEPFGSPGAPTPSPPAPDHHRRHPTTDAHQPSQPSL